MRLDKYLWCVRKFKTRSIATEAVRKDRISVNDEVAKASREVKIGDQVAYKKEGLNYRLEVLDIPKSRVGAKLVELYCRDISSPEELEKRSFMQMMHKLNRARGTGRPTKKERRDLDDFTETDL